VLLVTFLGEGMIQQVIGEPRDECRIGFNAVMCGNSWDNGGPMTFISPGGSKRDGTVLLRSSSLDPIPPMVPMGNRADKGWRFCGSGRAPCQQGISID
jgi:hypothetical protein